MWRTRATTAKGGSRGGLFVARRDSGSSLRDARERVAGSRRRAGERGERGAFYRASIAPVREIARRRIPRSIARTSRSIRRGIRSRTRAMRRSSARARSDSETVDALKKQKKTSVKRNSLPYRSDARTRVRGSIAVVDSLPRGAYLHRCAGSRQVPAGRLEPAKGVRSFVRSSKSRDGVRWRDFTAHAPGRGLRNRRNSNSQPARVYFVTL